MMYMERAGRRTLIGGAIAAMVTLLFYTGAPAQELRYSDPQKSDQPKPDASKQTPGRFQIIMHPTIRADQYLLDTATGQVWQLIKFSSLQGEPEAWRFMARLDSQAELMNFFMSRPNKKPEGAETPAPPPARAKPPAAPMKLNQR